MLILGSVDKTLIISSFDDIWTIKHFFSHDLHIYFWSYTWKKKKKSQFIVLKIPSHVVRLLEKIHALSIAVPYKLNVLIHKNFENSYLRMKKCKQASNCQWN